MLSAHHRGPVIVFTHLCIYITDRGCIPQNHTPSVIYVTYKSDMYEVYMYATPQSEIVYVSI